MQSTIINANKIQFPRLMKMRGRTKLVVLFQSSEKGTVVFSDSPTTWNVGDFDSEWDIKQFELFEDKIELTN